MVPLRKATLVDTANGRARFSLEGGWCCDVALVADGIGRVLWHPPDGLREPRTWAIVVDSDRDVPWEGRRRNTLFAGTGADATVTTDAGSVTMATATLRAHVRLAPFGVTWQQRMPQGWVTCC